MPIGRGPENVGAAGMALVLLLLVLGVWHLSHSVAVFSSGDDFVYAAVAVALVEGQPLVRHFDSPARSALYDPITSGDAAGGYASKYPIGHSLLLAPLYAAGGYRAMFLLNPLLSLLAILLVYRLTCLVVESRAAGLLAALLLGTLPPMTFFANGIGSGLSSLTFLLIALVFYARHIRHYSVASFWLFSFFCGVCFLIRNPNILLFLPIFLHQCILHRRRLGSQGLCLGGSLLILGAFIAVQLAFNLSVFDSLIGGYAQETGPSGGLSLSHMPHRLPRYLLMLCAIPPLGMIAMPLVAYRRRREMQGLYAALAAVALTCVVFYSAWWSFAFDYRSAFVGGVRFVFPIVPLLCLFVATLLAEGVVVRRGGKALVACGVLALVAASVYGTVELHAFKRRLQSNRDLVYANTAQGSLMIGPSDWRKFFFPQDGTGQVRSYASFDLSQPGVDMVQELLRLVDASLRAEEPVHFLRSEFGDAEQRDRVLQEFSSRYRLVTLKETTEPYALRIYQVLLERSP
ncbi:MAG: glycosyltransferase family 39 protein [Deltaproteobacteria bacterium]|nr:glycosyltransferase family 39 protein [Deltaproteobacteria bacterium]